MATFGFVLGEVKNMFLVQHMMHSDLLAKLRCTYCDIPDVHHAAWHIRYDGDDRIVKLLTLCPTCWHTKTPETARYITRQRLAQVDDIRNIRLRYLTNDQTTMETP